MVIYVEKIREIKRNGGEGRRRGGGEKGRKSGDLRNKNKNKK
jgi:hypothetical protein